MLTSPKTRELYGAPARVDLRRNRSYTPTGDTIEVTFNPALNGATVGCLRSITLKDKKEVEFAPN